jgi:hypothetical protein
MLRTLATIFKDSRAGSSRNRFDRRNDPSQVIVNVAESKATADNLKSKTPHGMRETFAGVGTAGVLLRTKARRLRNGK